MKAMKEVAGALKKSPAFLRLRAIALALRVLRLRARACASRSKEGTSRRGQFSHSFVALARVMEILAGI
ncbi:MAG: hypothetical protein DMG14_27905 [Acidobacteria bacterium]|nr:MAG: hypothetical protein DMG14_27905 [Acidobacteriota bacterium]